MIYSTSIIYIRHSVLQSIIYCSCKSKVMTAVAFIFVFQHSKQACGRTQKYVAFRITVENLDVHCQIHFFFVKEETFIITYNK